MAHLRSEQPDPQKLAHGNDITDTASNPFVELVRTASSLNWCTQPYCTTCGAMCFRSALREIGGDLGGPLADALVDASPEELTALPNWEGAVEIAVRGLPLPGQAAAVLESWLEGLKQNIRFADVVLYRLVRYLPEDNPVRMKWVTEAASLATRTRDFSLVESLILTLRGQAMEHEQLMAVARELSRGSEQMRRVLRNACGIDMDSA